MSLVRRVRPRAQHRRCGLAHRTLFPHNGIQDKNVQIAGCCDTNVPPPSPPALARKPLCYLRVRRVGRFAADGFRLATRGDVTVVESVPPAILLFPRCAMNQADTAWMLISTALVLLMTPALGFF